MADLPTTVIYSFLDVEATFFPNGEEADRIVLSANGVAEEGIKIEQETDKVEVEVGADGTVAASLMATALRKITVSVFRTSMVHEAIYKLYMFQTASASNMKQNKVVIKDNNTGNMHTLYGVLFKNMPTEIFGKKLNMVDWEFFATSLTYTPMDTGTVVP